MISLSGLSASTPAKAQIDHDAPELDGKVLLQIGCLLQNCAQNVAVVGVAGKGARSQHQAIFVGYHHRALDAELIGLASFPFANALDLRRMQRVQLVLVGSLLRADALGALEPH